MLKFRPLLSASLILFVSCLPIAVTAQTSVYESEPNNEPANALKVAGEVVLIGSMVGKDQDAYEWSVSDTDSSKRWNFELQGIPGALTIVEVMRIEYAENGVDVAARERLFTIGTRDGSQPSIHEDLLFEAGEYLLGVAFAGQSQGGAYRPPVDSIKFDELGSDNQGAVAEQPGGYRLTIREGGSTHVRNGVYSLTSRDEAFDVRMDTQLALLTADAVSWYQFDVTEKNSLSKWDLLVQVPVGRSASGSLYAADDTKLATANTDDKGKLSFPDLTLEQGKYFVELNASPGAYLRRIEARPAGVRVAGAEAEPNDHRGLANRVDPLQPLNGKMAKVNESDFFTFTLDESAADTMYALQLDAAPGNSFTLCITSEKGTRLQCREKEGGVVLPDLVFNAGDWGFVVERGKAGSEYTVQMVEQGAIVDGAEFEPNDKIENAVAIPGNNRIKGRFTGDDTDFYKLLVTDEPQLWRVQVIGDEIFELAYYDGAGIQSQRYRIPKGQRRVRLESLFLLPGIHHFRVTGRDGGDYTLLARPIGPPNPNGEMESNDDTSRMHELSFGQTRTGLLHDDQDEDNYRFHLANWDRIRVTLKPPVDGAVVAQLYWDHSNFKLFNKPEVGEEVVLEGVFPPGDYRVRLQAKQASDAEYTLGLDRLPRFECPSDCEPNDNIDFANPLPADHVMEGVAMDWRDYDWYRLPVFDAPTAVTFGGEQRPRLHFASREYASRLPTEWDNEAGVLRGMIPAGEQTYVRIDHAGPYRVEVAFPSGPAARTIAVSEIDLGLTLATREVSAYRQFGQRLTGELQLTNRGATPREVTLKAVTSDWRWNVELATSQASVPAGGTAAVEVTVNVPPDVWADRPVNLAVQAIADDGSRDSTSIDIEVSRDAPPVQAHRAFEIPTELRGGLNVARAALGGKWLNDYDTAVGRGFAELFDGMAVKNAGMQLRGQTALHSINVDIDLAGDEAVEVAGVSLNALAMVSADGVLKNLDVFLSLDGTNFTQVLSDELLPIKAEQFFVLDEPVAARYARLVLKHSFQGTPGPALSLGEFKVIAVPGQDSSNGEGYNLADPELGGHAVWSRPVPPSTTDQKLLVQDDALEQRRVRTGESYEWVIGFNHNRAAQITQLEWRDAAQSAIDDRIPGVTVSVSTDSPVGPWRSLGEWQHNSGAASSVFQLDEATWARFVKFTVAPVATLTTFVLPDVIRIQERPTDDTYRSIMTEWGFASQSAIFEELQPLQLDKAFVTASNDSKAKAAPLVPGQQTGGQVLLGKHTHWYRLEVPAGQNFLSLKLAGDPTVRTRLRLETNAGAEIPLTQDSSRTTPQLHAWEAVVEPGTTVFLQVEEPPRNVLFLWDTSASVGAYLPVIYNAMLEYAKDVVPGRDAANLLPFGGKLLTRDWYSEPYILQTILNDYPRKESSSEAEATLNTAAKALANRAGTKAIVMVTDAATGLHSPVWDAFREVRPRIFALGVGSEGAFGRNPVREQDLMQDWSRVNGGHYSLMQSEGEMEVAFDRAITMLRRPAGYTLDASLSFIEAPGPGSLTVRDGGGAADSGASGGAAIELILDASGSMLKRLDGKRRIAIAKEVLAEAVTEHIPSGTPVALRVFGHKEPNACRSDLEVPLAPLEPAAVLKQIEAINAMNLAKTPIADSLAAVESDLKAASGRKIVVLLTDGEETCEGDPAAVVQALQDKDINVTLNVVGFAIDDEQLEAAFASWAELGGGRYFQAKDQTGLSAAIKDALTVPYSVYDQAGTLVAEGQVGGAALELAQGYYRVVVRSSPARTYDRVEIAAGKNVVLE